MTAPSSTASARGSNALARVERLHIVGRPMPPAHELVYLAQVLHHDEPPISEALVLRPERFGGQPWQVDVVDFADARVADLLRSHRDDEIWQVLQRARPADLEAQGAFEDLGGATVRRRLRIALHTSHPVRGLRVEELVLPSAARDLNRERHKEAQARVWTAAEALFTRGARVTVSAIAAEARADKRTVAKALGTSVETDIGEILNNRVHRRPHAGQAQSDKGRWVA